MSINREFFESDESQLVENNLADRLNGLKRQIALSPDNATLYYNIGGIYQKIGQWHNSLQCYRKAIALKPDFVSAYINMGLLFSSRNELNAAARVLEKALSIEPDNFNILNNIGVIYRDQDKLAIALKYFQKAYLSKPDSYAVCFNLANTLRELRRTKDACIKYQLAIKLCSDNHLIYVGLGQAYLDLCEYELAVKYFYKALKIEPYDAIALSNLVNALMFICDWKELSKWNPILDQATQEALEKNKKPEEMPFLNLSRHADPILNLSVAKAWSRDVEERIAPIKMNNKLKNKKAASSKIIIGYLSNNFKDHPTSHLVSPIFSLHNRDKFTIHCYSYGENDKSYYRKKIENDCDSFADLFSYSNEDAANYINKDQVDILIDLAGYMKGARPEICAFRPAPIQIRWLGMAGSSGAKFYDYLIADRVVIPERDKRYFTEKIVYMPNCYQINSNSFSSSAKRMKKKYGLPDDKFVFAAFHTSYKIDSKVFELWMRILHKVPNSILWLMPGSYSAEKHLRDAGALHGIVQNRLIMAQKIPKKEHLFRLQQADIVLDTTVVNGAITASDALMVGVPVITLKGKHFASRMAASILSALNMDELITKSEEEYERVAVDLALNHHKLETLKIKIKNNQKNMPLFQTKKFVIDLENIFLNLMK